MRDERAIGPRQATSGPDIHPRVISRRKRMGIEPRPTVVERLESRRLFAVTFPQVELFNSDSDTYTPSDLNPFNDPPTGAPPPNVVDTRNGRSGLIEEIPSGAHGVPSSVGANLGEVYFNDPNDGPYGRFAFDTTTPAPNPNGTNA